MKPTTFIAYSIACIASLVFLDSCQELDSAIDSQRSEAKAIVLRQDCDNCDCHCFVELKDDNAASLALCGTCDGPVAGCSSNGNVCGNGAFTGDGHTIALTSSLNPRYDFCANSLDDFYIENTSTTDAANVVISCTAQSGTPQTITLALAATQRQHIEVSGECQVGPCP